MTVNRVTIARTIPVETKYTYWFPRIALKKH